MEEVTEEWRPVVGYEGIYEVSNFGAVRSLDRTISDGSRRKGQLISQTLWGRSTQYLYVHLSKGGDRPTFTVHSLVCEAFHGARPLLHELTSADRGRVVVRHIDGDSLNNHATNLAWGTSSENMQDTLRQGRHFSQSKTECANGHPYTEENTIRRAGGWRQCRICHRASVTRRNADRRAQAPPNPECRARGLRVARENGCPNCGRSNALMRALHADGSRICRWEASGCCQTPSPITLADLTKPEWRVQ